MHQSLKALKIYFILILAIAGWWVLAFGSSSEKNGVLRDLSPAASRPALALDPSITSINRDLLHQALSGDFKLMARLIADWDIDAQILDSNGFAGIKRISPTDFLQSQSLIRTLQNDESVKKSTALLKQQNHYVLDDVGNLIDLNLLYKKFLPQTFVSASFLLSLVPPGQIVALPRRMRDQTQLYPKSLTNKIPLDIDRYNAEKLFQARPEIAFVAHYSHPATIQALTNQGVALYTMKDIKTLPDISEELTRLGNITDRPLHAELMKIFIDAAIVAIDNQQAVLLKHYNQNRQQLPRVLVVNFHQGFSVPTSNTLTGQLLSRMELLDITLQYALGSDQSNGWSVPIDRERLLNLDPDFLIVATDNETAMAKEIHNDKALQGLSAVRNNRVAFVDESIQKTPSQFVVLAYHDLIQALIPLP